MSESEEALEKKTAYLMGQFREILDGPSIISESTSLENYINHWDKFYILVGAVSNTAS